MRSAQTLFLTTVLMLLISLASSATILRVNNTPEAGSNTYASLDLALNDASTVQIDTILIESSDIIYDSGGVTINKQVRIYGTGFYLDDNPCTQADKRAATFNTITFGSGSEGSLLGGVIANTVRIEVSQIRLMRCNIENWLGLGTDGNITNCMVYQCFIEGENDSLVSIVNCTNFVFRNNLINQIDTTISNHILKVHEGSGIILNNIFKGGNKFEVDNIVLKNTTVQNNQFGRYASFNTTSSSNVTAHNCISEDDFLADYGGTTNNHTMEIFTVEGYSIDSLNCHSVMLGVSRDAIYQINSAWTNTSHPFNPNPAYFGGADGLHIGLAGGSDPYVLSGMPPIPSVAEYSGSASGTPSSGSSAAIKGKSRR